jgi:signal transduction histidine kinase/streptogramin lyase
MVAKIKFRLRVYFFLSSLILFSHGSFAQGNDSMDMAGDYRAVNWNYTNGLLYGRTNCFLKDINGFLWVGTQNGLNRFDGSHFKNYLKNSGNHSIAGNTVYSLVEDSLHNIWAGTDIGVSIYNCRADNFTHIFPELFAVNDRSIVPFWATANAVYCLESDSIFTSYDVHTFAKKRWASLPGKVMFNTAISLSVFEPASNAVWLLPAGGKLFAKSGLLRFSLSDGKLENFNWGCYKHPADDGHWTEGICYDKSRNSIWLNTSDGLIQFSLDDKTYHLKYAFPKEYDRGIGIQTDAKGNIWMCTMEKGIIVFDPSTGKTAFPFGNDSTLQGNVNNFNFRLYCDREGIVWVGYWPQNLKGIMQIIPISRSVTQYAGQTGKAHSLSTTYGAIMTVAGNKVWLVTMDGMNIYDPSTGFFSLIKKDSASGIGKNKSVSFIGVGRTDQHCLVYGNETGGLFKMDLRTRKCIPIGLKDAQGRNLENIRFEDDGVLFRQKEILLIEEDSKRLFLLGADSSVAREIFQFSNLQITHLASDQEHYLFLKFKGDSAGHSFEFTNGKLSPVSTAMDSLPWNNIVYNPADHSWWVGGYGELTHYNKDFSLIRKFGREDGVPIINVWGIVPDDNGNIWFNTELSVARLSTATGEITRLSEHDGWKQQGYKPGNDYAIRDDGGRLYFFGYNFLDVVDPSRLNGAEKASYVYLKGIGVNEKKMALPAGVNEIKELNLKYDENVINVETGIIDYYSRGKSQIRYKLGRNGSWQYGSSDYIIHYEGLQPGEYTLIMQAANAANEYNGPEKILLIHIKTPWWQTWWAYLAAGLLVAGLVWAIIWYRSRSLLKSNIQLEEKIQIRTGELNHSLKELKDTQAQLIQREKMASLGELTAGIAHEIQNPLNFINNFSEVNTELMGELKEADNIQDRDPVVVNQLILDIDENMKKITHHGKRADAIVKSMLQHSRTNACAKTSTDINGLMDEYIRLAYHGWRAKNNQFMVDIRREFSENTGSIQIVSDEIGRVVLNLLNNSFYSVEEKRKLSKTDFHSQILVSTRRTLHPKSGISAIEIVVRDNGIGIPEKLINKIYQPFFTTKPTGEGTGLGLSLCYDIITKVYRGDLIVTSKVGEFAEFAIYLPI